MIRTRLFCVALLALAAIGAGVSVPASAQAAAETSTTVSVRAKGNQGTESVNLIINGTQVASWPLTGSYQTYTHIYNGPPTSVTTVRVGHTSGGWPNAILVDYIDINETRHQSEDPKTLSSGTWAQGSGCDQGYKQSEWLSCDNGWFQFTNETSGLTETEAPISAAGSTSSTSSTPIVIFDTDMGPDIDDALALAMLHAYEKIGKAKIAAVTISRNSIIAARYTDLVNTFYGRPDIPIGVYRGSTSKDSAETKFTADIVNSGRFPHSLNTGALPEGHLLMRDILQNSPDNSVVIVQVGFSTNTALLLEQFPDLVARKARLLSVMAGDNNLSGSEGAHAEFNIKIQPGDAKTVFDQWPNQLIQTEFDLGYGVLYPLSSIYSDFNYVAHHPIKDSYLNSDFSWHENNGSYYNMRSWDLLAVIAAIENPYQYFSPITGPGKVTVDASTSLTSYSDGSNAGDHYVLTQSPTSSQRQQLVDRMIELTSEAP